MGGDAGSSRATTAPAPPVERIEAIDALRGVALFGVLMVNLVTEFRVSLFAQFIPQAPPAAPLDRAVMWFVSEALESKAFCLFSLLFGVGLAIQAERLQGRPDRALLLVRRMAALLLFGLIHLFLVWNGDILTEYAVVGFLVLPLLFAPTRAVGAAAALFLTLYAAMPLLPVPVGLPDADWLARHVAQAHAVYSGGSYGQVVAFNIAEVGAILPLHLLVLPRTLGLFALGAWLWRIGLFRAAKPGLFAAGGLLAGLAAALLIAAGRPGGPFHHPGLEPLAGAGAQMTPVLLALAYAGLVLWLATNRRTRALAAWAAPLGRTAFSNYLLESLIFSWVFFGWGLGLFDRLQPAAAFALGLAVYVAQVVLSRLWLRRFRFGPMEWLWRALMYGRRPAMRRVADAG